MSTQNKPALRWINYGAIVIGILGACFLGGRFWIQRQTPGTLAYERRMAAQAGLWMEPEDMARKPAVNESQNAAMIYRRLTQELAGQMTEEKSIKALRLGNATEAERRSAGEYLSLYAPQLALAQIAIGRQDCDFRRSWEMGTEISLPELGLMRRLVGLLSAQAVLTAESGNPLEALHILEFGARIARHSGNDPIAIAMLVQIALESMLDKALQQIVLRYRNREDVLNQAEPLEAAFGPLPDLERALQGEAVLLRMNFERLRQGKPSAEKNNPFAGVRANELDRYEARHLAFWRTAIPAVRQAGDDPMAVYRALKAVTDTELAAARRKQPFHEINAALVDIYPEAALKRASCEAKRRLRRTLLALLANHRQTNAYPESLGSLTPPPPPDPFTGQPFHYRRTERGFLLYSVGENLRDDGGKPGSPDTPLDLVINGEETRENTRDTGTFTED